MKREEILDAAKRCVCGDREQDYGSPENNFLAIADLWAIYLSVKCISNNSDVCILPEDVAAMLALLKIARIASGHAKEDRWERAYKGTSFQTLADRYGVSKKTMQNAIKGVTWKCVPYMPQPPKED